MSLATHPGWTRDSEMQRLRLLYRLLSALTRAQGLQDVYDAAMDCLLEATGADRAAILMFDPAGVMRFEAWRGLSPQYRTAVTGHTPWQKGSREACSISIPDALGDPSLGDYHEHFLSENIGALAFIPLALDTGAFGKFMLYSAVPHHWSDDEIQIAEAIASHVAIAVEKKRSELARRQSEERLQAILDHSGTVIFLKDLEGRYILINRQFETLFGVHPRDVVGKTDLDLFSKSIAERLRANDVLTLERGQPTAIEESVPQSDGQHTFLSVKFPLKDEQGATTAICGIATDITTRKRLEDANQRLAAIVESSDDAILSEDLEGQISSWNAGAERIFGYAAPDAIGKPVAMLWAGGSRPRQRRAAPSVEHYEAVWRRKDGQPVTVGLTVSPLLDSSGGMIGESIIARDITERKKAEQERLELLAREKQARRTAELLNRVGPKLLEELDLNRLVQAVTDTVTELVGAEFAAFFYNVVNEAGESYMLYTLSGADRKAFADSPMPRTTELFGPTFRGEGVIRCEDVTKDPRYGKNAPHYGMPKGHLPVRSYLAVPVVLRSGEVVGGLFFGHASPGRFTGRHEEIGKGIAAQAAIAIENARLFEQAQWVQRELKRSNEELRRANRDLETFAYSASHDLQEPLRNVALAAQLLERSCGADLADRDAGLLRDVLKGTRRMNDLVQDLLAYTQATRYAEGTPPEVDCEAVLARVAESLRVPIEESGAAVTWDKLPAVHIHESRLTQLLQNLVSNAIKYRSKSDPYVHISAAEEDGWTVFSVSDNGIGIEPQYAGQIFGLFKRLHRREDYPGSGIGLAICQRIVEQYGGRIWLDKSAPGEGSTFCFSVPFR